jgi:hypothetical protein
MSISTPRPADSNAQFMPVVKALSKVCRLLLGEKPGHYLNDYVIPIGKLLEEDYPQAVVAVDEQLRNIIGRPPLISGALIDLYEILDYLALERSDSGHHFENLRAILLYLSNSVYDEIKALEHNYFLPGRGVFAVDWESVTDVELFREKQWPDIHAKWQLIEKRLGKRGASLLSIYYRPISVSIDKIQESLESNKFSDLVPFINAFADEITTSFTSFSEYLDFTRDLVATHNLEDTERLHLLCKNVINLIDNLERNEQAIISVTDCLVALLSEQNTFGLLLDSLAKKISECKVALNNDQHYAARNYLLLSREEASRIATKTQFLLGSIESMGAPRPLGD